jgi:hypothetical protein
MWMTTISAGARLHLLQCSWCKLVFGWIHWCSQLLPMIAFLQSLSTILPGPLGSGSKCKLMWTQLNYINLLTSATASTRTSKENLFSNKWPKVWPQLSLSSKNMTVRTSLIQGWLSTSLQSADLASCLTILPFPAVTRPSKPYSLATAIRAVLRAVSRYKKAAGSN